MDAYRRRTLLITLRRAEKLWQGFFDDLSHAALASTALTERAAAGGGVDAGGARIAHGEGNSGVSKPLGGPVGSSCGDHTDALTLIGGAGRGRRGP